jgi:hypothetical protein
VDINFWYHVDETWNSSQTNVFMSSKYKIQYMYSVSQFSLYLTMCLLDNEKKNSISLPACVLHLSELKHVQINPMVIAFEVKGAF